MPFCPEGVNTGIIELTGPITSSILESIAIQQSPISISFGARKTPPAIIGNRIDESSDNTILYKGIKYTLASGGQICAPLHRGYTIPGQTIAPRAELVLSFSNSSVVGSYPTGILLCLPIYEGSEGMHSAYIEQMFNSDAPAANLQTLFFDNEKDMSQISLSYKTCFDTMNVLTPESYTIQVIYFPNGITLTSQIFEKLIKVATQTKDYEVKEKDSKTGKVKEKEISKRQFPVFELPPALRNAQWTVRSYKYDKDGNKTPSILSPEGYLYTTQYSSASDEFKNRFQFFTKPPSLPGKFSSDMCPYYKTTQYKCVPFNSITDLSGDYVIPGGASSLKSILDAQNIMMNKAKGLNIDGTDPNVDTSSDTEAIIITSVSVILAGLLLIGAGSWIAKTSS